MAGKIRVKLVPNTVFLTPTGNGNFSSSPTPPAKGAKGAFPVVIGVEVSLEQNAGGTMPITVGQKPAPPCRMELVARQRNTQNPPAYALCATLTGTIALVGTPAAPVFTAKGQPPGSTVVVTNFAPATTNDISRSDFGVVFTADNRSVLFASGTPPRLILPWIFDPQTPVLQLNARLFVNNALETDVTGTDANQPIDIPLQHDSVPDEAVPNNVAEHPLLKYFGLGPIYSMTLQPPPARVRVPSAGLTVNVWIDASAQALVAAANLGEVRDHVRTVLMDAGFATVNVDTGQTAAERFAANMVQGRSKSTALWFMSRNVRADNRNALAEAMEKNTNPSFSVSETVQIPFFDFYICAQNADPPASSPDELGHSERITAINGADKSILTPIVLTAGSSRLQGLRKALDSLDGPRQAIMVAQVICHEIGHSLGLRHTIAFPGAPPYVFKDSRVRGTMGPAMAPPLIPAGATAGPFQFFGPVHRAAIRSWYL